ncbi:MAG: hypothetical protein FWG04_05085 [Desulfovibrionaceae bacterium]|nr:hypothetical protein [Desulfovibrionaceae bacterium]
MPRLHRRIGLFLCACLFAFSGALPQAQARGPFLGFGASYYGGGVSMYSGRPYYGGYHRGHWPRYRHHGYRGSWLGVGFPVYPRLYYEQGYVIPDQPFSYVPPQVQVDTGQAHLPPLRHSYQDIAPNLRSLFEPAPPADKTPPAAQAIAPPDAQAQYIVYPVRARESREAWERAQRWFLGDVPRLPRH